jgi:hypothetical protein
MIQHTALLTQLIAYVSSKGKVGNDKVAEEASIINTFWDEVRDFQTKSGKFEGRDRSWVNHPDLMAGTSYFWHAKESCKRTEVFGKLGARTSSKILGIGSAERAWGDVKQLKSGKRSHLSADKVKKQATLFGESAMRIARSKQKACSKQSKYALSNTWYDEDLKEVLKMLNPATVETAAPSQLRKRYFYAFMEPNDLVKRHSRDDISMHSLLQKYGGMYWEDGETQFRSDPEKMVWHRVTKNNIGGWCLIAYDDTCYQESLTYEDNRKEGGIVECPLSIQLIYSIAEYHLKHPELGVTVLHNDPPATAENVNLESVSAVTASSNSND